MHLMLIVEDTTLKGSLNGFEISFAVLEEGRQLRQKKRVGYGVSLILQTRTRT